MILNDNNRLLGHTNLPWLRMKLGSKQDQTLIWQECKQYFWYIFPMLGYVVEKIACYYKKKKNNHKGPELWLHNLFSITEEKIVFLNFFFFPTRGSTFNYFSSIVPSCPSCLFWGHGCARGSLRPQYQRLWKCWGFIHTQSKQRCESPEWLQHLGKAKYGTGIAPPSGPLSKAGTEVCTEERIST